MELLLEFLLEKIRVGEYLTIPLLLFLAALLLMDKELLESIFTRKATEKAALQKYSQESEKLYAHFLTNRQRLLRMEVQPSQMEGCEVGASGMLTHRGRHFLAFHVFDASKEREE